jgi:hypothetical protein
MRVLMFYSYDEINFPYDTNPNSAGTATVITRAQRRLETIESRSSEARHDASLETILSAQVRQHLSRYHTNQHIITLGRFQSNPKPPDNIISVC